MNNNVRYLGIGMGISSFNDFVYHTFINLHNLKKFISLRLAGIDK